MRCFPKNELPRLPKLSWKWSEKCIRSNILKVHELFWSVELHNMIFVGPSTKRSKFFREPVNGDSSRVLHEEFKSYGWGQLSRSPAVLWLGWKWSWMLGWAFRCWKAGLLSPAARILDSISQNLPAQLSCSWNTGSLKVFESHSCSTTLVAQAEKIKLCMTETSSHLCSGGSDVSWKWRVKICS